MRKHQYESAASFLSTLIESRMGEPCLHAIENFAHERDGSPLDAFVIDLLHVGLRHFLDEAHRFTESDYYRVWLHEQFQLADRAPALPAVHSEI